MEVAIRPGMSSTIGVAVGTVLSFVIVDVSHWAEEGMAPRAKGARGGVLRCRVMRSAAS